MAFSRSLLIKGIAGGLGACTACAGGVGIYKSVSSAEEDIEKLTDKQLIDKAGLNCELDGDELTGTDSKDCSVKTDGGKINVKNSTSNEDDVTFQNPGSGGAKLKVSRSTEGGYSKKLKFVVDSGDITLTKTEEGQSNLTINKLGQYETYEIKEKDGKYYLSLKDSVEEGKIRELGLPVGESYCKLLETGSSSCKLTEGEIKKVKFNGQDAGVTVTGGSEVKLTITKTEDSSFTDGYRFTFTFPSDVTISSKEIKANTPTDFKIKKAASGNGLSLEKAWSDDNEFIKKVGLNCSNTEECTVSTTGTPSTLSVKVGEKTKEGINSLGDGGGKIKLEKDQPGYNQGLKFTITTGDITLNNGGQEDINKLEQFETYEITESGGKYFLTKKTGKEGVIKTSLGLPTSCNLPAENIDMCSISADQAKGVKFDGERGNSNSKVDFILKIEKTDDTSAYPHGYKFTLMSDKDVSITNTDTVKGNTNTVFKIKKTGEGNTLSLEKAWEISKVLEKVGLSGCAEGSNECAIKTPSGPLNIKRDNKTLTATGISGGKIKFSKDQEGYNQGFKFTISDNDVSLTVSEADSSDNKLEELETYEITEEGDKYYLTRKTTKEDAVKKSLSIPGDCFAPAPKSNACSPLKTTDLSKINFDGKNGGGASVDSGRANLTISKVTNTTDFPLGYRFTFLTTGDMTISDKNTVKANIPTEFKIKKGDSGNTLTLEKAWNNNGDNLIAKVGLENCSTGNEGCTIKTTNTPGLNVKQGETVHVGKNKSSAQSNQGKIKLYKDKKGYLEGLKFVIEDGDITLDNTGGSSSIKLTQFETYGIEEKEGKYYLSRKTDGKDEKIKKLGLPEDCKWEESSSSPIQTCSITQQDLKSVNFKNKKDSQETEGNGSITVEFAEVKDKDSSSHPEGLKVSFISLSNTDINIPLNSSPEGGAIILKPKTKKEFKISKENAGGTLSLEKAFDINNFVKDAGLQNCYDNIGCSLKDKISVWLKEKNYSVNAKVSGSNGNKVTYVEGKSGGYNEGIEFTLQNSITLQKSDSSGDIHNGEVTSLNSGDKFQVIQHKINETSYWFLSKVEEK